MKRASEFKAQHGAQEIKRHILEVAQMKRN
jgi:hypothetical protein